ncbi:MAG: hypothetical protein A2381_07530 [Bdellovibrionales bacterium RIFOXYB1_FULL_37_110]|nr:MAG: hypothetical protein A2181_04295 [Bdellovibrionales bacterium RIFOXYA1_FULL_38_20]OFZ52458.1 MAG: hypothetical protein A2417_00250 [Bdellovibrionales bacterium RIFOXYC1_FULL_37_79]OFZ59660.1 MAG: hypothetical protein A2381_07530 [Bdellovibrionales bacterium RIFOXYB1_FULL_37_110]OFZ61092.1 MAG: hypothetical protein A2328_07545 [Bdellovibrionales bacterium RIFOXYB2_FULL_36_6]OFZ62587.1 MAG: hypothetical protein A2577_11850 [Bdellovibrionales bacterium RIFOXYD1_FULL_36_51]
MHFKAKPWDYERICKTIIDLSRPGLYLFHSFDPYLDVYFSLKLKNLFLENPIAGKLKIVLADEITSDWLDAHLESAELFGNNDSYVVLMAEKLGKPVFAEILKNAVHIKDKFFILNFSKESPFMEEASSLNIGHVASIIKPMFWENEKLFDFICKILKLNLSNQNRKFLIANLSASTSNYVAQLSLIRKMFLNPDQIKIDDLKKMITNENFDYFASASKFSKKDKFGFMKDLISGPLDFEELNNFFVFMIRHLMKLIDAEQLMEKLDGKKLNDYNKEIMICSKLWTKEEIRNAIRMFSLWQKMARAKDNKLIDSLRSEYLHQVT